MDQSELLRRKFLCNLVEAIQKKIARLDCCVATGDVMRCSWGL
jgi:hypothetical protein